MARVAWQASGRGWVALRVVGGRYELVAFVGRGGMGEVWEGRDRVIERRVAVKLLPHDRRDASGAELFFREARTAGGLSHAGVVTVFDLGQDPDEGTLYLVMEFLTGRDLDTALREDGAPHVPTAVDWAAQTAAALQAAHTAGVVHRDLKPANLMLTPGDQVKILDFGIARYMASTHKSSKVIGTLAYMPPERFGDLPADPRSDLYSLGCVLHELLTGSTPFHASEPVAMMAAHLNTTPEPPGRARPGVPAALDDLVLALLAKDPDDRPASAAEVRDRLRELSAATPAPGAGAHLAGDTVTKTITTPLTGAGPGAARTPVPVRAVLGPAAGTPTPAGRISRRTALRLVIGAGVTAAVSAGLLSDRPADPRLRWRYTTGKAVTSTPAVVDGVVYIGSDDKNVYALDAATGKRKWAFAADNRVRSSPAVADGGVYVGSADGSVYALDAATGNRQWTFDTGNSAFDINTTWVESSPAVADKVVYVGSFDYVSALDAATGDEKWAVRARGFGKDASGFTSPAVVDGVVYVGSDDHMHALDAATGDEKWAFVTGGSVASWPAVVDGFVYVGSNKLFALAAATGDKKWAFHADEPLLSSSPAVVDGVVYVGSDDKNVYALDAATGKKKWVYATGDKVRSSPAVADGVVYVGSLDHNVYALDTAIEDSPA
ncbi:serine/threonine-protein kinase [Streptomyces sp. ID38640]|uniref:serine/threonine-protein kinase n=1 Tax=Streptomyces sp. ID38640 TaxID=1265399 RepID=UPI00287FD2DD|nr:serine/threonine-protein kinase [Streptomyces sp. ID38640]